MLQPEWERFYTYSLIFIYFKLHCRHKMLKYVAVLCCLKNGSYYSVMVLNKSPEAFCVI